jgi:non-ribosomal peptide synthetase component F
MRGRRALLAEILGGLGNGAAREATDTPQPFDEWPLDFVRPTGRTARNAEGAHVFRVRLEPSIAAGLRDFAQKNGASLHALMLTMLAREVRRRTGRSEFLLGTAASTRDSVKDARVVGYYVNMLPVPCRVDAAEPIEQSLQTMQRSLAEGLLHARYPFARMYKDFRQDRAAAPHPARYPLFDLVVAGEPRHGAAERQPARSHGGGGHALFAAPACARPGHGPDTRKPGRWRPAPAVVRQRRHLYEKETAEAWIDALAGWARFLAGGKRLAGSSSAHSVAGRGNAAGRLGERARASTSGAQFPRPLRDSGCRTQPDRPALITEHGARSYAEVNARANALAHALLAHGVAREEPVGVLTDRSIALPETVLAIWKAGACYVPLASDLPADRLAFIARDAGIRVLVVLDGHQPPPSLIATGCLIFRPESLSEAFLFGHRHSPKIAGGIHDSDLAYIVYTSGSTGAPKGVMLHHRGLNNLGMAAAAALGIRSDDRLLMMASPAFDASIADLAMAWAVGAAVVPVLRDEMGEIAGMRDKLARLGVSMATMAPSYLRLFEQADFPGLRILMTVGEPPHRADALHYAGRLRYVNGYGPSENTVATSFGLVTPETQRLTVGKPLANTSVHILDGQGLPVPPGAVGNVWLGGMGSPWDI